MIVILLDFQLFVSIVNVPEELFLLFFIFPFFSLLDSLFFIIALFKSRFTYLFCIIFANLLIVLVDVFDINLPEQRDCVHLWQGKHFSSLSNNRHTSYLLLYPIWPYILSSDYVQLHLQDNFHRLLSNLPMLSMVFIFS